MSLINPNPLSDEAKAAVLESLQFLLAECEVSLWYAYDLQDMDAYLYNAGRCDGLREMAVDLTGDPDLINYLRNR